MEGLLFFALIFGTIIICIALGTLLSRQGVYRSDKGLWFIAAALLFLTTLTWQGTVVAILPGVIFMSMKDKPQPGLMRRRSTD